MAKLMMVQRRTVQRRTVKTRRVKTRRVTPPARARPRPTRPLDPPQPLRSARLPGPTPRLLGQERQPFGRARPPRPVRPLGQRWSSWARRVSFPKLAFVPCAGARLAMAPMFGSAPRLGSAPRFGRRQTCHGAKLGSAPASGVAACDGVGWGLGEVAAPRRAWPVTGWLGEVGPTAVSADPPFPEPLSSSGTVGASRSRSPRLARMATTARLASATRASSPFPAGTGAKIAASSAARPEAAIGTWRETDIKILRPLQKNRLQKNRRQENRRQECKAYSPSTQVSRAFFFVYPKFEHDAVKIYVFSPHNLPRRFASKR